MYSGYGPYNEAKAKIDAARPEKPPGGDKLTVDPQLLMADDVRAEPEWDVKAEKAFRDWAIAQLAKSPPVFDMYPDHDDEIITRRTALGTYTTKGLISLADLRHQFADQYAAQVTDRQDWKQLRTAFADTVAAFDDATEVHRERSRINKENRGWFGVDIVRNIIEAVGEGDQDYPSIRQWDEPKALIEQARPMLAEHKFELAVPLLAMAEMSTAQAAQRIFAYDNRVESGARIAVKWLGRVKTAGSIAASIAAGPLGITGSALVAGGYTFVQEGAQNASAMAHGQRTDFGFVGLVKQAGMATVMGLMGGALQSRFQAAMAARLTQITGTAGGAVRDIATSSAAAMTSSVYTTAVESVLASVVAGQALPKNATEFADLIVDNALKAGAMDVALRGPSARAAREYQSWRGGGAAVTATDAKTRDPNAADFKADPKADPTTGKAPDPMKMPEDVAQRLLRDSGGWDRLSADLHAGTGLGHGLMPAERRALLNRFEASRELLARDVAGMFQGSVSITDGGHGQALEIQFTGDGAETRLAQAREYLDVKRPGWAAETGVSLQAGAKAVGGPKSLEAIKALERATPEARKRAAQLAPLYEKWTGLNAEQRLQLLADVVNQQLRQVGVPEVHPAFGDRGAAENGSMNAKTWELQIKADLLKGHTQTADQFADVCGIAMHEAHHALQLFRAARTNPVLAKQHLDTLVFDAVMKANRGDIPAEKLRVDTLEYAEAAEVRESLWGSGRTYNEGGLHEAGHRGRGLHLGHEELQIRAGPAVRRAHAGGGGPGPGRRASRPRGRARRLHAPARGGRGVADREGNRGRGQGTAPPGRRAGQGQEGRAGRARSLQQAGEPAAERASRSDQASVGGRPAGLGTGDGPPPTQRQGGSRRSWNDGTRWLPPGRRHSAAARADRPTGVRYPRPRPRPAAARHRRDRCCTNATARHRHTGAGSPSGSCRRRSASTRCRPAGPAGTR